MRTRFLSGYALCGSLASRDQTYYKQCLHLIQTRHLKITPQEIFREGVLSMVDVWWAKEDRIVLMIDINNHSIDGKLSKELAYCGIWPTVYSYNGAVGPNMHFWGNNPIDEVWVPDNFVVLGAAYLPF